MGTNLASLLNINYIDADVEEPNGFIFLKPLIKTKEKVKIDVPIINQDQCNLCLKCLEFCQFNVFAKTKNKILIFEELCHSCGGCKMVCPTKALDYRKKTIGFIEKGVKDNFKCYQGILKVGEVIAVPLIKELLKDLPKELNIIDASPGTSCNAGTTLEFADKVILVTEPTKLALHDLKRIVQIVKERKIPLGIIINKVLEEDNLIKDYCKKNNLLILGSIKYKEEIAYLYSEGKLLEKEEFKEIILNMKEYLLCK